LDYLCQQLGELNVTTILPEDIERCEIVINRAIDVRTACMQYLTSHIRHDATSLGTMGNLSHYECVLLIGSGKVIKNIFRGDEKITDATSYLKSSIDSYNNALGNINLRIVIKMYELLKGIILIYFCGDSN
jgi:hypothetical protein